jgi:dephospho-CoA kinase
VLRIGLSGNRFSGKDTIGKHFEKISIPVFYADIVLKYIIKYSLTVDRKIKAEFPTHDIFPKLIDTFTNTEKFDKLIDFAEAELFDAFYRFEGKNSSIYTIFQSSILFERGWDKKMDGNISVFSPKEYRIKRAMLSDSKLTQENIYDFMSLEMDDIEKNRLSNYIIHNYDEWDSPKQVNDVDQKIIDAYLKREQSVKILPNGKKPFPVYPNYPN